MDVDGLKFSFPSDWQASQYDKWSFYRNQFITQQDGLQAVDIVASSPQGVAYLIEVKDYRHPDTEKPTALSTTITHKVIHTLAALLPARLNAHNPEEKRLAASLLKAGELRVIAHIEQPGGTRQIVDLADLKQKLKKTLRAIDPHVKIVSTQNPCNLPWSVS